MLNNEMLTITLLNKRNNLRVDKNNVPLYSNTCQRFRNQAPENYMSYTKMLVHCSLYNAPTRLALEE